MKKSEFQNRKDREIALQNFKMQQRINNVKHKIHFNQFDEDYQQQSKYQSLRSIFGTDQKMTHTIKTSSPIFPKSQPLVDEIDAKILRKIQCKSSSKAMQRSDCNIGFKRPIFCPLPKLIDDKNIFYEKLEKVKRKAKDINDQDFNKQTLDQDNLSFLDGRSGFVTQNDDEFDS